MEKLLEDFVGKHHAAVGEAQDAIRGLEQPRLGEAADGLGETLPFLRRRADAGGEAQADEEALFAGIS